MSNFVISDFVILPYLESQITWNIFFDTTLKIEKENIFIIKKKNFSQKND
jgi:hypothetical protein